MDRGRRRAPFSLEGDVAVITGGGTGLGLGIARCMVEADASVVLVGRREELLALACEELGEQAEYEVHDVLRFDEAPDLVERASAHFGPISILVNNAGIHLKKPALHTTETELVEVFNTHVTGAYALCRAAAPAMLEAKRGSILLTASMASLFGIPNVAAYTIAKTAHLGLVRALTVEFALRGIRVNAIAPGWIESPMMLNALEGDPERKAKILGRTPMARFGAAEDIGHAAVYLASDAAKFVTGVVLPVDGGASIGF